MNGSIQITEAALASLIGLTAHEIPGVVGMAPANLREGLQRVLGRAQARDGVVVSRVAASGAGSVAGTGPEAGSYTADLYVVLAYGVSIPTVARNIAERVEHVVRAQAGTELSATRVHAVGVARA